MSTDKPHRIRVKVIDGKPRERNRVKGQLVPHVDVVDVGDRLEFVICAVKPAHLDVVRAKLAAAGLEEVSEGDTTVGPTVAPDRTARPAAAPSVSPPGSTFGKKPYGFVQLPDGFASAPPIWHDGSGSAGRLSGEVRFEVETLTPLLVGWERRKIDERDEPWSVPSVPARGNDGEDFLRRAARQAHSDEGYRRRDGSIDANRRDRDRAAYVDARRGRVVELAIAGAGMTTSSKSVLCPLRAPWGAQPALIPGDSLKGLLRHELGALLGAPMERVAERSYSYRPNSLFPNQPNPRLVARLARVPQGAVTARPLDTGAHDAPVVRVPTRLDLLPLNLRYDRQHQQSPPWYRFDATGGAPYRGGLGAGARLNSKRNLHRTIAVSPTTPLDSHPVPDEVQVGYLHTVRHLAELRHGHFSERHPDVPNTITADTARDRILEAARDVVFQPGDVIWVEWDTQKEQIVSLGWHYYYRWAYTDTVRRAGWTHERQGLFPLPEELATDEDGAPEQLSAVRRLFGYTGDNDGSKGIGRKDHEQLMGRLSLNAAVEVVEPAEAATDRFLPPTFLRELGMPRPSAVEHYLEQPHHPNPRPSDEASLVTYGDAAGYDEPGKLAGRKFYLDRADAYTGEPWKDDSEANRLNDRSTLALEASRPGRRFRFTLRFRDLDPSELAATILALCPHQLRAVVGGSHADGYCSKLGYARPLGWGSVRIEAKELLVLDTQGETPKLKPVPDISPWIRDHYQATPQLASWLAIHRHKHPDASDYPRGNDGNIYSFHTDLRAQHTRARRYERRTGK